MADPLSSVQSVGSDHAAAAPGDQAEEGEPGQDSSRVRPDAVRDVDGRHTRSEIQTEPRGGGGGSED